MPFSSRFTLAFALVLTALAAMVLALATAPSAQASDKVTDNPIVQQFQDAACNGYGPPPPAICGL